MKRFKLRMTMSAIIIFIGALISAFGAIYASIQQERDSDELTEKNNKIANLTERINSLLTGGDSFCYVYLDFTNTEKDDNKLNYATVYVIHEGEFPLSSISVEILESGMLDIEAV